MSKYTEQARDFLSKNEITLIIKEALPQKMPLWINEDKGQDYGVNYWVIIKNRATEQSMMLDFWGSIDDKYANKRPTAYDILACLDIFSDGNSFEDFCSNYGYETDSRKALKTYKAVMEQTEDLKRVFSLEQLEELNEIQ